MPHTSSVAGERGPQPRNAELMLGQHSAQLPKASMEPDTTFMGFLISVTMREQY